MPRKKHQANPAKIILCLGLEGAEKTRLPRELRRFGYRPVSVPLEEGLAAPLPDGEVLLVILDLSQNLGKVLKAIRTIRSHISEPDLPVLLLSSVAEIKAIPRAIQAGADDYLLKPLDSRLLFARVNQLAEVNPRMHYRVACDVPLEILTRTGSGAADLQEIGEGGLRTLLRKRLATGELAVLRFFLPRQKEQVAATGVCVYGKKTGAGFSAGFKFVLIEKAHQRHIQAFIRKADADGRLPIQPEGAGKGKGGTGVRTKRVRTGR